MLQWTFNSMIFNCVEGNPGFRGRPYRVTQANLLNNEITKEDFLCPRMGRVKVQLHSFLTKALDGKEWTTSRVCASLARNDPRYPWIGGFVCRRACKEVLKDRKISLPLSGFKHQIYSACNSLTILRYLGTTLQWNTKYSRTSNNGHCRGIQILSVIGGVR
jgi:hypothetical protein